MFQDSDAVVAAEVCHIHPAIASAISDRRSAAQTPLAWAWASSNLRMANIDFLLLALPVSANL